MIKALSSSEKKETYNHLLWQSNILNNTSSGANARFANDALHHRTSVFNTVRSVKRQIVTCTTKLSIQLDG